MSILNLDSWSQFRSTVSQIRDEYNSENEGIHESTKIVFRGHTDAKWKLETTRERYSKKKWSVDSYVKLGLGHRFGQGANAVSPTGPVGNTSFRF